MGAELQPRTQPARRRVDRGRTHPDADQPPRRATILSRYLFPADRYPCVAKTPLCQPPHHLLLSSRRPLHLAHLPPPRRPSPGRTSNFVVFFGSKIRNDA